MANLLDALKGYLKRTKENVGGLVKGVGTSASNAYAAPLSLAGNFFTNAQIRNTDANTQQLVNNALALRKANQSGQKELVSKLSNQGRQLSNTAEVYKNNLSKLSDETSNLRERNGIGTQLFNQDGSTNVGKTALQAGKEGIKSALYTYGLAKGGLGLKNPINLAFIGGGALLGDKNKSFGERVGESIGNLPYYSGFSKATNPYISKVLGPVGKANSSGVVPRLASGVANTIQGVGMDKVGGMTTTPFSAGVDFVAGVMGGKGQFETPNAKGMLGKKTTIFKPKGNFEPGEIHEIDKINDRLGRVHDISAIDNTFLDNILKRMTGAKQSVLDELTAKQKLNELLTYSNKAEGIKGIQMGIVDQTKGVIPEVGGVKTKTEVQPPETKEQLPWESPDQKVDTSLEGIEANRTSIKPSISETGLTTPKQKLETAPLKVSSDESITPPKAVEVQNTSKAVGKVNLLDWFRTPDRVMNKIGLGKEAELLRTKYNDYLDELPKNIEKITSWYEQVKGSPDASKRLFQYLDGQKVDLSPQEMKVAGEMQAYLKEWADRLDLPYDKRIASYITHIFDKDFIQKDFDEDLAKIISEKIPGSVYDPFLQQRLGKNGYIEDVFKALDAYTKRATRKVHMDEALGKIQDAEYKLDLDSWKYVKSYTDRINLRPQQIDSYLDNLVKQSPVGYKLGQRPTAAISRGLRRTVYRGTLGLNIGSAIRNLTQGVNTYAKLGEKYTAIGYMRALKQAVSGSDELARVGVLRDNMVQDRQLSAVKGFMEKLDKGLFSFFNMAENINRGSAYYGAKAKFLDQGLNEEQAIKKAVDLVRDTQFTFGSVDTPLAMQGDIVKFLTQFQSFNVKQTEFIAEMAQKKEFAGLLRWLGANLAIATTVGGVIGLDFKDMIPFYSALSGETKLGETPPVKFAKGVIQAVNKSPDEYGNVPKGNVLQRIAENKNVTGSIPAFIPGGVQAKKTIEGVKAYSQGASTSKTGRVRYPIEPGVGNAVRSVTFGQYNLPGAKQYFDENKTPLSDKQSKEFVKLKPEERKAYYDSVMTQRQAGNEEDKVYEALDKGDYSVISQSTPKASAEAVYRYINKQDKAQRQDTYNQLKDSLSQQVKDELKAIQKLDAEGVGKKDRDIMLIPQEIRARAVFDRIMELEPKNRQKKYDELMKMGIITPSMKPILKKLQQEAKK